MFNQLFPQRIDNTYRGHKLALWLFGLIVLIKAAMSVNSIFLGHKVATSADGIPLDTFPPAAVGTIISMFAIWGFAQLMICLLCALVLFRYRAMVPLMFAFLLLEHLGRKLVLQFLSRSKVRNAAGKLRQFHIAGRHDRWSCALAQAAKTTLNPLRDRSAKPAIRPQNRSVNHLNQCLFVHPIWLRQKTFSLFSIGCIILATNAIDL